MAASKSKRRRYTAEERAAALADVAARGVWSGEGTRDAAELREPMGGREEKQSGKQKRAKADVSSTVAPAAATEAITGRAARAAARRYTPSQKAEAVEHATAHGVSAASENLGISRFSIYGWMRQVVQAAKGEGPSPTSGPGPVEIETQRDRESRSRSVTHPSGPPPK